MIDSIAMATRFYFHLVSGDLQVTDRLGIELRKQTVMSAAVVKIIRERWPGTSDSGDWTGWSVEIVDEQGRIVRTIALDDLPGA
jgi:hypothetical protein